MPKIKSLTVRAVRVPMATPHRTASGRVTESPLVLTDILGDDGVVGHSVIFTYTTAALKPTADLIRNLEGFLVGAEAAPVEMEQKLSGRFRLLGTQGLVGMALAAIDMALWDALRDAGNTRSWNCWAEWQSRSRLTVQLDTTEPKFALAVRKNGPREGSRG